MQIRNRIFILLIFSIFLIPTDQILAVDAINTTVKGNNLVPWLPNNSIIVELTSDDTAPLSAKTMDAQLKEFILKYGQPQITQTFAQLGGCKDQKCFTDYIANYLQKQGLDKWISSLGLKYPPSIGPLQRVYTLTWSTAIDLNAIKESLKLSKNLRNATDDWVTGLKNFSQSSDTTATLEWAKPYLIYLDSSYQQSVLKYLVAVHPLAVKKFLSSLSGGGTLVQYTTMTGEQCVDKHVTETLIAGKDYVSGVVIAELVGDSDAVFNWNSVKAVRSRHGSTSVSQLFDNVGKTTSEVQSYFSTILQKYPKRSQRRMQGLNVPALNRFYEVKFQTGTVKDIMNGLCATNLFKSVSPDYYVHMDSEPNDHFYDMTAADAWGSSGSYDALWGLKKINAPDAWNTTTGDPEIIIAVLDTGLDTGHEDIGDNWMTGYDFVNDDEDPADDQGHGTHVAGTIAAEGNNSTGITGVMWNAKIMPLKIISRAETGSTSDTAKAIKYATENGADVINMSLHGIGSRSMEKAVQAAYAAGIVLVSASGNGNESCDEAYPGMYDEVIMVGGSTADDERTYDSQYCEKLDLVAPGGGTGEGFDFNILSLRAGGTYSSGRSYKVAGEDGDFDYILDFGTSMAVPHVSGAVGLLLSAYPSLQIEEIRQILRTSATDIGEADGGDERDDETGYGRLDIGAAFTSYMKRCDATITSPDAETAVSGDTVSVMGYAGGDDFARARVDLVISESTSSVEISTASDEETTLASFDASDSGLTDGEYKIYLIAYDDDGNVCGADSATFTYSTATSDSSDSGKHTAPDCGCNFGNDNVPPPIDLILFIVMLMGTVITVRIWVWHRNRT